MGVRITFKEGRDVFGNAKDAGSYISNPVIGGGGFPAYGTVLSTLYGVDYEIGVYFVLNGVTYYSYSCDVNSVADGVGGSFYDWTNATYVTAKTSVFYTDFTGGSSYVTVLGNQYTCSTWDYVDYFHDGAGSYNVYYHYTYAAQMGDFIYNDGTPSGNSVQLPDSNFYNYQSWSSTDYFHDGSCGFYTSLVNETFVQNGDYIYNDGTSGTATTTLPDAISYAYQTWDSISYYWQDSAGNWYFVYQNYWYADYGDYITDIDGASYYWDGNGGYYT